MQLGGREGNISSWRLCVRMSEMPMGRASVNSTDDPRICAHSGELHL